MPKMCPYNRAREVQRYKQKNELDESGNISSYAYEMREMCIRDRSTKNCGHCLLT